MTREARHSANWGGSRENAGRPKEIGEVTAKISFRLDAAMAEKCKANGGSAFIRDAIRAALEGGEARMDDHPRAAAEEGARMPRGMPWLRSVRRGSIKRVQPDGAQVRVPVADMRINCGVPLPAPEADAEAVTLSDLMIHHPETTYLAEATGDSMVGAGICEGDKILLDRGLEARNGDIVLAFLNGEMTLKRLRIVDGRPQLHPENEVAGYPDIIPGEYDDFQIQGVLIGICRRYR